MDARRALVCGFTPLLILTPVLAGCDATPSPTAAPTQAPPTQAPATQAPPTQAPPTAVPPTKAPPTAVPTTATSGPRVGGTMVYQADRDLESLDPHKFSGSFIGQWYGSGLVALSPDGKFTPYLADSWSTSDDGRTWTFKLKQGVKFHDGTPFTAKDYVYTFDRVKDPATGAGTVAMFFAPVVKSEAPDDYTFQVTLNAPFFPFLYGLADAGYGQPLSKGAAKKAGDQYGRTVCVSVGPFKFKEWAIGEKIVLERNPDFNWGPPFMHKGPYYIQNLEFRIITEYSTAGAGV